MWDQVHSLELYYFITIIIAYEIHFRSNSIFCKSYVFGE